MSPVEHECQGPALCFDPVHFQPSVTHVAITDEVTANRITKIEGIQKHCPYYNPDCPICPKEIRPTGWRKQFEDETCQWILNPEGVTKPGAITLNDIPYVKNRVKRLVEIALASQLAEIEEKVSSMKKITKPTHGTCCTCQDCGYSNEHECECPRNHTLDEVLSMLASLKSKGK